MSLLTPSVVASRLGVSESTLYRWRRLRKHLPFVRVGDSYRYRVEDVEDAIKHVKVEVAA